MQPYRRSASVKDLMVRAEIVS